MSVRQKFRVIILFLGCALSLGCVTKGPLAEAGICDPLANGRFPAGISCENLFPPEKNGIQVKLVEGAPLPEQTKKTMTTQIRSKIKVASSFIAATASHNFWEVVSQLAENPNARIELLASGFTLTKTIKEGLKLHTTYAYETLTNDFVATKIEYTEQGHRRNHIELNPQLSLVENLKRGVFVSVPGDVNAFPTNIHILERVSFDLYETIVNELPNLNQFTAHEILKLSKLPVTVRAAKFSALVKSREFKKYLIDKIWKEHIVGGIKTIVITFVSVVVLSQTQSIKNMFTMTKETPQWVAPSIVKMAGNYAHDLQPEIVRLMKLISSQPTVSKADLTRVKSLGGQFNRDLKIDESDYFSFRVDPLSKQTYFFITHELENGQLSVYATAVDPHQYPSLIGYFESVGAPNP